MLLLVNYRPEYNHGWGSKTYYTQLRLDPLGKESAEEMLSALNERQPLGRMVTAQEVAYAIAHLASPLSASTTGIVLRVDAGMSTLRI